MYAYLKHPLWGQILNCLLSQRKLVIYNVWWRLCKCLMISSNSEMSVRVAEQMQAPMSVLLSRKKKNKKLCGPIWIWCILFIRYTCTHSHTHIAPANPLSMHLFIAVKTLDLAKYLPHVHVEDWTGNPEAQSASRPSCQGRMDPRKEEVSTKEERRGEERGKKERRIPRWKKQLSNSWRWWGAVSVRSGIQFSLFTVEHGSDQDDRCLKVKEVSLWPECTTTVTPVPRFLPDASC